MATIVIRKLDEAVKHKLQIRAARNAAPWKPKPAR